MNQGQCDDGVAAAEIDEEGVRPAALITPMATTPIHPPQNVVRAGDERKIIPSLGGLRW